MCMLFGFTAKKTYKIGKTIDKFFQFSKINKDGWGLAIFRHTYSTPDIYKEPVAAYKSNYAKYIIKDGIEAQIAIAHIRYATAGKVNFHNTHPFVRVINGRQWVFAHNGSVNMEGYEFINNKPSGETDSEKIFCLIEKKLSGIRGDRTADKEIKVIENTIKELSSKGKLNILLTDGKMFFVHSNYKDTLYMYQNSNFYCFSTKVENPESWKPVPLNKLMVFKEGKKYYESEDISNEYKKVI
ncbi:class II glutamine amidotransferase [Clostridium sp. 19966]|uniref:class II glutamine amidotransferase n=1 Tax=Clostridium sp. 19966 TaxID=2768166 RepID=UPI0028DFFE1B|nr:class II glutamine amidotransferase [Clostridium sp. 19966]MDT8718278.1 class II glutamine amidotransferase [Clostridium sp. 19966]